MTLNHTDLIRFHETMVHTTEAKRQTSSELHPGPDQRSRQRHAKRHPRPSVDYPRTATWQSEPRHQAKRLGYGGFPMPLEILQNLALKFAPSTTKRLQRSLSQAPVEIPAQSAAESHFASFMPRVGRNSVFLGLTKEQKEELGGIEYRASKLLLKIVYCVSSSFSVVELPGADLISKYIFLIPVLAFTIIAPLLTVNEPYAEFFESQHRMVASPWFAMFNVWSSFTNCGLSLSDTSMIPFIESHVFVFSMSPPMVHHERLADVLVTTLLIFAGNTAYVCQDCCSYGLPANSAADLVRVLRSLTGVRTDKRDCVVLYGDSTSCQAKNQDSGRQLISYFSIRDGTSLLECITSRDSLQPRCFLYLFPSRQTWYLLAVLVTLTHVYFEFLHTVTSSS